MIIDAQINDQPFSGDYLERIYDIPSPWNTQGWTWIKFTEEDLTEWYGNFRGFPHSVASSVKHQLILVLTSDYLFKINRSSGELLGYEPQSDYRCLTASPAGDFIVADYYNIYLLHPDLQSVTSIPSPVELDMIEFKGWKGNKLQINCIEFLSEDIPLALELDGERLEISVR
ncbi:hypothetical protein [Metaplanococcus flavidus]|uniref:Uncharacterized protein n=1 Tax=Metaplanococcus flavidus TaxID=569883 RepID=A0ABW3L8F8_9BACL